MSAEITSDEPESVRRARTSLKLINRWTYGSAVVGFAMMTQASWWVLAAAAFFLIAIIGSITILTKLSAARGSRADYGFAVILLLCCSYFLLGAVGQLVFFSQTNAYADCVQHALTISKLNQCNADLQDGIYGIFLGG